MRLVDNGGGDGGTVTLYLSQKGTLANDLSSPIVTDFWEILPLHPLEILTLCGLDSLLGIAHYLGQDPPGYQALPSFETAHILYFALEAVLPP